VCLLRGRPRGALVSPSGDPWVDVGHRRSASEARRLLDMSRIGHILKPQQNMSDGGRYRFSYRTRKACCRFLLSNFLRCLTPDLWDSTRRPVLARRAGDEATESPRSQVPLPISSWEARLLPNEMLFKMLTSPESLLLLPGWI
jgi:hypothetical protein